AKNRIFGLLSQWGLRVSVKRLRQADGLLLLERLDLPAVWRASVAEALAVVELLDQRIAPIEAELAPLAQADGRVQLLRTIPGIGSEPARFSVYRLVVRCCRGCGLRSGWSLRVFLCIGWWLGVVGDAVSEVDAQDCHRVRPVVTGFP